MRSARKITTARAKGPVTSTQAKPEDLARIQAAARAKRRQFDTTVYDDPKGLKPIPTLDGTASTSPSLTPDEAEDFVREQARAHAETRHQSNANRLWGAAYR